MTRAFCIPEPVVAASPIWERVLLFLAVALMESFGITVAVTASPEHADVEGFVLTSGRPAIIATWIRSDHVWRVGLTSRRDVLDDFGAAAAHACAQSVIGDGGPARRLAALAGYLGLDWAWLSQRCAGLADQGWAGLACPRSRLLSIDGLDAACRHVRDLSRSSPAG